MKLRVAVCLLLVLRLPFPAGFSQAREPIGWQPQNTWLFVVGALHWKHPKIYGSFPVKNRRDAALVDFFRGRGIPRDRVVYLRDEEATQQRIDRAFADLLGRIGPNDLLIVYYCGHGSRSDDGEDVYLASYDAGDEGVDGWSVNSIPRTISRQSRCSRVLWLMDCCYSGQAARALTQQKGGPAFACVTSSAASQSSTEHWTFTDAVLDALRGHAYVDLDQDGSVTLAELAQHVESDMNLAEEQFSTFAVTKGFDPQMVLSSAEALTNPRIGERAQARDEAGDWYACRIVAAADGRFKIHFIGYEDEEDRWVTADEVKPLNPVQYPAQSQVEALWKKR